MSYEVFALYFSPTGNTAKAVRAVAKGIAKEVAGCDFYSIDLTAKADRCGVYEFGPNDIVIIGMPTYAGRIPNKIEPYVSESIYGNGALAVPVVTYGNRAFDDSLKELSTIMYNNGMNIVGFAAVPSEHAFSSKLATDRPSEDDLAELTEYGSSIGKMIQTESSKTGSTGNSKASAKGGSKANAKGGSKADKNKVQANTNVRMLSLSDIPGRDMESSQYYKPLKEDGEPASFLKAKPVTDASKCTNCNECKDICPMGCYDNSPLEAEGICIKCHGCIKTCPVNAKHFEDEDLASHIRMLEANYSSAQSSPLTSHSLQNTKS